MNRKVNMGMILTAVFLLTGLLVFVGQAKAASDEWRSTWVVDADFVGNTPNVQLKVTVERNLGAGWFLYAEQVQPLDCRREGGVLLVNDTAVFEGNGSIKCAMPSLQGLVRQMTAGRYTPSATCDCKGNPMITSDVILAPNI
ncbi:MAG TPA: hypothetical protein PLK31_23545, partial [Chloroflexota bacterium]|nr:hypothetical protein [Chloroflexota bacterium]